MATTIRQLLSQTTYAADGVTTVWNFTFADGYIDKAYVKARVRNPSTKVTTQLTVTLGMFTGPNQLTITPAVEENMELTIYRDTPKTAPLVDYIDSAVITEQALDTNARQAVHIGAESADVIEAVISASDDAANAAVSATAAAGSAAAAATSASGLVAALATIAAGPVVSVNGQSGVVVLPSVPVFQASLAVAQTLVSGPQVANLTAVSFNKDGTYNNTPGNCAWLPSVPGYYRISGELVFNQPIATAYTASLQLHKNGVQYALGTRHSLSTASGNAIAMVDAIVYLNGTSDYVQLFISSSTAPDVTLGGSPATGYRFYGSLVRPGAP